MKIIVDAFGGDNAPLEVIKGCRTAIDNLGVEITLTGNKGIIEDTAVKYEVDISGMDIIHTQSVIDIHEKPTEIIKSRSDCSMALGLQALCDDGGDAFVSAGSSGALVVGATFITKRIKGIKRAVLAPILPTAKGHIMLVDGGANDDCRPEMLLQFGMMASAYMEKVKGISAPKVGLVNIGEENTKGRELEIETYKLMQGADLNFCGNLEARELPKGEFDVAVTDGFTGNVILKLYEGMGSFLGSKLKEMYSGFAGKLAALLTYGKIKDFKKQMDYTEEGGAVLLGINKPVIKAHGSSDAKAFYNAIRQAKACVDGNVTRTIAESLEK